MPSCPSCGKGVPASAKTCGSCGKAIAAPAAAEHSYDLMPEEPKAEAESGPSVEPAPRATAFDGAIAEAAKPGEIIRPKISLRDTDNGPQEPLFTKGTAIAAVIFGLMIVFFTIRSCKTEYKIEGSYRRPQMDLQLGPGRWKVENFVVKGGATFEFEVTANDGDLLMGVIRREPKASINAGALKSAAEGLTTVPKGETRKMDGPLKPGTYSWVILNEGAKPVKGKIKFMGAIPK